MKTLAKNGFTFVELLIGMIAAAILALVAGTLLTNSYQGWQRSQAAADMERDAALAIHTLELAIRGASNAVPGEVGIDRLKVMDPDGVIRAFSVQTSGGRRSLYYNPNDPGGEPMVLVDRRLGTFVAATTANLVRVSLTLVALDQNNQEIGLGMGFSNVWIRMRN